MPISIGEILTVEQPRRVRVALVAEVELCETLVKLERIVIRPSSARRPRARLQRARGPTSTPEP